MQVTAGLPCKCGTRGWHLPFLCQCAELVPVLPPCGGAVQSCWAALCGLCPPAVVRAVEALSALVVGKSLQEIVRDFRGFYRLLTSDGQIRWVRTEQGHSDTQHHKHWYTWAIQPHDLFSSVERMIHILLSYHVWQRYIVSYTVILPYFRR